MRILHCIPSVNPSTGGPIEGVIRLGQQLRERGHVTEIASLDPPDAPWVLNCEATVHAQGPAAHRYGYTSRLVPWLKRNAARFDVVVANGLWQFTSLATRHALRGSGTPYVVFPHGMLAPWFKHKYPAKHLKKWLYWPWAEYQVLRDAAAVIFTCEEERLAARQSFWLYSAREAVVSYGTADPGMPSQTQIEAFLAAYPRLRGKRLILFLGRLHPIKGCDILIKAFADVMRGEENSALVIVGNGEASYRENLVTLSGALGIGDRVFWTGELRERLKWGALGAAEVFMLPSHHENFGIAVVEALACGVPVLISDKVNIWREIIEGGAGMVSSDTLEGARSLLTSWRDLLPAQRNEMRVAARQAFCSRFDIHFTADSLLRILSSCGVE